MAFLISEVVQKTGISATTIHYYVRLGLLPAPHHAAPNRFEYDDRHVRSLRLIRGLRESLKPSLSLISNALPELLAKDDAEAFDPKVWREVIGRHEWKTNNTGANKLLKTAVEEFSRRGFDAVNVEELCTISGVAKGSFYRYYPSKLDLYFAAGRAAAGEVADSFKQRARGDEDPAVAAPIVTEVVAPRLPLFLDLLIGALQNRPGYAQAAKWVMVSIAYEIGTHMKADDPLLTGAGVLESAVVGIFWEVLMPTPVDHPAATVHL